MKRHIIIFLLLAGLLAACSPSEPELETGQSSQTNSTVEIGIEAEPNEENEGEHSEEEEHEEDGEHREFGAHEHGAAQLTVAWSGSEIAIDFETPAFNVLGFEYAPSTTAEKQLLADSLARFEEGNLFQILSPDAECAMTSAIVETSLFEEEHDEEVAEHEEEEEESHSDIEVSYNLTCQNPENIEALDAGELFNQFPNFEEVQVQWLSDTQQSAQVLTADNTTVVLE